MNEKIRSHHKSTFLDETRPPLVRLCHRAVFTMLMLVVIAAPLLAGRCDPGREGLLMLALLIAGGFWIVRVLVEREAQVVFSPLGAAILALATYVLIWRSDVEAVARPDMLLGLSATLLFFLVLNDFRHRWQITLLVWTLTGLGTLFAVIGLWQWMRGAAPAATFARPVDLAVYLLLVMPVAASNFLFSRRSVPQKIGFAFASLLMCAGFAVTGVAGHWLGWLAAFLIIAGFVLRKRGWRFRWLAIGASVLIAVLAATLLAGYRLRPPSRDPALAVEAAGHTPPPLWRTILPLSQRNLWLGTGPGMIEWLYPKQRTLQSRVRRSGSEYCNLFVETGVVGCGLVGWILMAFIVAVAQILNLRSGRYSAAQQSNRFAFVITGLAVIAAVIVNGVFDQNMRVIGSVYTLVTIMGAVLTCGVHRRAHEEEPVHQPGRYITLRLRGASRYVLAGGLGAMMLLILSPLRHSLPSAWLLSRGHKAAQQLDWSVAEQSYMRAWKSDPRNFEIALALGDLFTARATWNAQQRDNLIKLAFSWYRRARTLNPYDNDVLVRLARLHDLLGEGKDAHEAFKEALKNDPRNSSYRAQLDWHYQRWDEDELATQSTHSTRSAATP